MSRRMPSRRARRQPMARPTPRSFRALSEHIPPYNADPINVRKLRYSATNAGVYNISRGNLLSSLVVGTIANSTVTSVYAAVRLKSVSIYAAGSGANPTYTNSSITWLSENAPDQELSVTGNPNHPGTLRSSPPVGSLASFWSPYNSGNLATNLFQLSLNSNDIIETVFEWVPANGVETVTTAGFAAVTLGNFYYLALDGRASNKIVPVSNPTTA